MYISPPGFVILDASALRAGFGLTEAALILGGRDCGLHFCLFGPRSVRLEAIWVADRNTLYFYDARGTRFLKIQLRARIAACAV